MAESQIPSLSLSPNWDCFLLPSPSCLVLFLKMRSSRQLCSFTARQWALDSQDHLQRQTVEIVYQKISQFVPVNISETVNISTKANKPLLMLSDDEENMAVGMVRERGVMMKMTNRYNLIGREDDGDDALYGRVLYGRDGERVIFLSRDLLLDNAAKISKTCEGGGLRSP